MNVKSGKTINKNSGHHLSSIFVTFLLFISTLAGCASTGPDVNYDKALDFSQLHTFTIIPSDNTTAPTLMLHVEKAIEQVLISRGLQKVVQGSSENTESSDIEVSFIASSMTKEDGTTLNVGLGTGSYSRSGSISLGSIFSIPIGDQVSLHQTLQIDITKDSQIIYSASGSVEIDSKDTISIQQKLDELVESLLASFPPN